MEEMYDSLYGNNVTIISNEFLDKYLSDTDPIKIKVFLFYLWKGLKEGYSISEASNEIDIKEDDIEMALRYWIKKKIMKKDCLVIDKKDKTAKVENRANEGGNNTLDFETKKKALINKNRKSYEEIEKDLLFVAEKLIGRTLSERQQNLIAKCYNDYGFEEGLIHYLLEFCTNKSQTNVNYMSAIATSWYEQGINSVEDAKNFTENFNGNKKSSSRTKKKTNTKLVDRDEYNKMFLQSVLNNNKEG